MKKIIADSETLNCVDKLCNADSYSEKAALFRDENMLDMEIWIVGDGDSFIRTLTSAEKLGLYFPGLSSVSQIFAVDFNKREDLNA